MSDRRAVRLVVLFASTIASYAGGVALVARQQALGAVVLPVGVFLAMLSWEVLTCDR